MWALQTLPRGSAPDPEVYRFGFRRGSIGSAQPKKKAVSVWDTASGKPNTALGSLLSVALSSILVKRGYFTTSERNGVYIFYMRMSCHD